MPLFLLLAIIMLCIGWKTNPITAPCRRFAYFSLASAFYFCIASRAVMITDNGHSFDLDPAKITAGGFFAIAACLFFIAARRKKQAERARPRGRARCMW